MALQSPLPFDPVTPPPEIQATSTNFKSIYDFTDQFIPELAQELYLIRNRSSIHGWLASHGMEESFAADQFKWAEEGERHIIYESSVTRAANVFTRVAHAIRVPQKIEVYDAANDLRVLGRVESITTDTFTVVPYGYADFNTAAIATTALTIITAGSEFGKGTDGQDKALEMQFDIYDNKPIIEKDLYTVNNSDLATRAWFSYGGNYYWYDTQFEDTYERFLDECEYSMLTAEKADDTSPLFGTANNGTEGYFSALRNRGGVFNGFISTSADIKSIIKLQDRVHGETMSMMYVSRDQSFAIDDWLSTLNGNYTDGTDYGLFKNDSIDVDAVKLGFTNFKWGEYHFSKNTWNVLTNPTKLGSVALSDASKVHGVIFPMGFTNINQSWGEENAKRVPYLTLMYREMPGYSRKMEKFWLGSGRIANATTSADRTEMHLRREAGLRVIGARKHVLIEG